MPATIMQRDQPITQRDQPVTITQRLVLFSKCGKTAYLSAYPTRGVDLDRMDCSDKESRHKEVEKLLEHLKVPSFDAKTGTALFNRVTFVLTHDRLFTEEQRASVAVAAKTSVALTKKQKKLNLPAFRMEDERYTDEAYDYEGYDDFGSHD
jgi:hypothetical protein